MPNAYAVIPNIIPGNVTIGGNLTVNGDQLRVGSAVPFIRLQRFSPTAAFFDFNWDRIAVASDVAGSPSHSLTMDLAADGMNLDSAPAGTPGAGVTRMAQSLARMALLVPELRVGAGIPFIRLAKLAFPSLFLSHNLQTDQATRDDPTGTAGLLEFDANTGRFRRSFVNTAGGFSNDLLVGVSQIDPTSVTVTGTTVETTAKTYNLQANALGLFGGLLFTFFCFPTSQGATATTFRFKLGGVAAAPADTVASVISTAFQVLLVNTGAANSQRYVKHFYLDGSFDGRRSGTMAVDTTVAQNVTFTIQPGATTDNWAVLLVTIQSFAPRDVAGF